MGFNWLFKKVRKRMKTHNSKSATQSKETPAYDSAKVMLKRFFKNYDIKYHFEADIEKHSKGYDRYWFDYQGGHFVAFAYKTSDVDFIYPGVVEVPVADLEIVRSVCNMRNVQTDFKHAYEINKETGMVAVHLVFYAEAMAEKSVPDLLSAFFDFSRRCRDQLMDAVKHAESTGTQDVERVHADSERELFLVRNQEMAHGQCSTADTTLSPDRLFTLGHLLRDLLDRKDMIITRLQVVNDEGMTIKETGDNGFDDLNLASLIIDEKSKSPAFRSSVVTVIGTYHSPLSEQANATQVFTITLREAGATGRTAFFRLMLTLDPGDASERQTINGSKADKTPTTMSLLLAYDFASADQLRSEADYMWKDAQIKQGEGNTKDLTDEQQLLLDVTDANVVYHIYWGRKYMLSNRYYDAIAYLENAYLTYRQQFFTLSDAEKNQFYYMAYCLGFCYCELGLYEKAYYYLSLMSKSGNMESIAEYVNVLANSGDIRVFYEINGILKDLDQRYDTSEEMPENVSLFRSFLGRRHAFSLIEFGMLDEAEKEFKKLLNDPSSLDYAVNELAYIKKLRQLQGGQKEGKGGSPTERGE